MEHQSPSLTNGVSTSRTCRGPDVLLASDAHCSSLSVKCLRVVDPLQRVVTKITIKSDPLVNTTLLCQKKERSLPVEKFDDSFLCLGLRVHERDYTGMYQHEACSDTRASRATMKPGTSHYRIVASGTRCCVSRKHAGEHAVIGAALS